MTHAEKGAGFLGQRITILPQRIVKNASQQPVLKGLLPTHAGFFPKARGHLRRRPEGASQTIFIYCVQGEGWCQMKGVRHEIVHDQLLVIPAGVPHEYGASARHPWTIYWFHAIGENTTVYQDMLGVTPAKPILSLGGDTRLLASFEDVLSGVEHGFTLPNLVYAAHALLHVIGLMIWYRHQFWHGEANSRERITRSINFMRAHLSESLSTANLAAMARLSVTHYINHFKRATGYTPINYLIHLRMQRAGELLHASDLSIKEIGNQVGYPDQFHFSRVFRGIHGISPSKFRRANRP